MKKVLFIVGSLRENSFNKQMAKQVEKMLNGKAEVSYLDYKNLPIMNQDSETPTLPVVQDIRNKVLESDLLWIFSPVYNFAIPGSIKNLLDWLSRAIDLSDTRGASALQDKKVTVSSVGNAGHDQLFESYTSLLKFIRTEPVGTFTSCLVNPEAWTTQELVISEETISKLENQIKEVL